MVATPTAMAVGLPEELANACIEHVAPLPLVRAAHVAAACEHMIVMRPQIVLLMAGSHQAAVLRERAQDVRAEIAELTLGMNAAQIRAAIVDAKLRAAKRT